MGRETIMSASHIPFKDRNLCDIYQHAKAKRKKTHGKTVTIDKESEGYLEKEHFCPGNTVSFDHFESRIKGRTYISFGRSISEQYVGGFVFVDSMIRYIRIKHRLGFSSSETIREIQAY